VPDTDTPALILNTQSLSTKRKRCKLSQLTWPARRTHARPSSPSVNPSAYRSLSQLYISLLPEPGRTGEKRRQ